MKKWYATAGRALMPIVAIAAGFAIAALLSSGNQEPPRIEPTNVLPIVRTVTAAPESIQLMVVTDGTMRAEIRSEIVAEVGGRITAVADELRVGATAPEQTVLVRIDPRDYEIAIVEAESQVARARVAVAREQAEADAAIEEWKQLGREGEPSELVTRKPQLKEANANLKAAEARLEAARRDLQRTTISAPFDATVAAEFVDVGQFVTRGSPIATLEGSGSLEVSLPIHDRELAFLSADVGTLGVGAAVTLRAEFAGRDCQWQGQIVRTEGRIDETSQMLRLVARVAGEATRTKDGVPLLPGTFVTASIHGEQHEALFAIPSTALRGQDEVLIVDGENRLQIRKVDVLRRERDRILIRSGLAAGERISTTKIDVMVPGMPVRAGDDEGSR